MEVEAMAIVNSVFSTYNGGYTAHIYKNNSTGYRVEIQYKNKMYGYYCTNEEDCYRAIDNLTGKYKTDHVIHHDWSRSHA